MKHRCTRIVHKALAVVRPQFRFHFAGGVHGLPHWSRVWFHGRALATSLDVDPAVPAWFAFLHDSQRHNDGRDPAHGARVSVSSQFDGPMITIDDAEQPSLSVISEGVLANGYIAIKFGDVHQGHDQERRQR